MKIKVLRGRNKKTTGKAFDLGNVISGDLEATKGKYNPNNHLRFDKEIKIGNQLFKTTMFHNTSANNNLTVKLVNVNPDMYGNERHSYFDLVEIIEN